MFYVQKFMESIFTLKDKYFLNKNIKTYLCSDGDLENYFKNNKMYDNTECINFNGRASNRNEKCNYTH